MIHSSLNKLMMHKNLSMAVLLFFVSTSFDYKITIKITLLPLFEKNLMYNTKVKEIFSLEINFLRIYLTLKIRKW